MSVVELFTNILGRAYCFSYYCSLILKNELDLQERNKSEYKKYLSRLWRSDLQVSQLLKMQRKTNAKNNGITLWWQKLLLWRQLSQLKY